MHWLPAACAVQDALPSKQNEARARLAARCLAVSSDGRQNLLRGEAAGEAKEDGAARHRVDVAEAAAVADARQEALRHTFSILSSCADSPAAQRRRGRPPLRSPSTHRCKCRVAEAHGDESSPVFCHVLDSHGQPREEEDQCVAELNELQVDFFLQGGVLQRGTSSQH